MTSTSGLGATSITLQFDLDRNIDGAAQDVQTAINAASGLLPKDLPNPPTYRKINPADRAGPDLRGLFRRAADLQGRRLRLHDPGAEALDRAGRLAGRDRRPAALSPCASRSIPARSPRAASASRTCAPRSPRHVNRPRAISRARTRSVTLDTNDQLFNAAAFDNVIVAYRNGAPVRLSDVGDVDRRGAERRAPAPGSTASRPRAWLIQRQAGANTIEIVDRSRR